MNETALYCDMAETYHILDYRTLPARQAAKLAAGLRPSSRIMQALTGVKGDVETVLLAHIADAVRILAWQNTKDGRLGRNQPASLVQPLLEGKAHGFRTVDEFEAWRAQMIGDNSNGN